MEKNRITVGAAFVLLFVVIVAVLMWFTGRDLAASFGIALWATVTIFCIYSISEVFLPIKPDKVGTVYSRSSEDSSVVTICTSEYAISRRPFSVFADGEKVAEIYRGKELHVPIPKGMHEIMTYQHKGNPTAEVMDVQDGLSLFIGVGIKMQFNVIQIAQLGDRSVFEERAKRSRKKSALFLAILMAYCVLFLTLIFIMPIL